MSYVGVTSFGKKYIVIPMISTLALSMLHVRVNMSLMILPEYRHLEFVLDNTLHTTLAKDTEDCYASVWPHIRQIPIEHADIPVTRLEILRKPVERGAGAWELTHCFPLLRP